MTIFRKGQAHRSAVAAAMIIGGGESGGRASASLASLRSFLVYSSDVPRSFRAEFAAVFTSQFNTGGVV
jgi:hypothetical protein